MSAPKLTVREVVAILGEILTDRFAGRLDADDVLILKALGALNRYAAEVEAEEREEHRRALEAAESEAVEPW